MGREIIAAGLCNRDVHRARHDRLRGVSPQRRAVHARPRRAHHRRRGGDDSRARARLRARDRAQVCWTLGITEHHNAVGQRVRDHQPRAADRARRPLRIGPRAAARPEQRAGRRRHGRDSQQVRRRTGRRERPDTARSSSANTARTLPPERGLAPEPDVRGDGARQLRTLYVIGENPAQSEADGTRALRLLEGLDHIVVQDIFLTQTAELADVVLPAAAAWCESEGTVTSSERRVQRVRKALDPPGDARDDIAILCDLARRLGHDWGTPSAEDVWNEVRRLSPWHGGMSYRRLEELDGLQWPCPDGGSPGQPAAARSAVERSDRRRACAVHAGGIRAAGRRAHRRLSDAPDDRPAARFVQHRRADGRLHVAAAIRRDDRPRARGRRATRRLGGRARPHRLAARRGATRRCDSIAGCGRAWRS